MKIVTVTQMQKAERDCSQYGVSLDMLMENAGKAVAEEIRSICGSIQNKKILIAVGPGNNGGDGLVSARHLHDWGACVSVYLCGTRPENDPKLEIVKKRGISVIEASADSDYSILTKELNQSTIIIDAIFGTGTSRAISGSYSQILKRINEAKRSIKGLSLIALDLPSGLDADSGTIDPATPSSDYTITLGFPKIGLYNLPGAERAGNIRIVDIGIPANLVDYIKTDLIDAEWIKTLLPKRSLVSYKGSFGKVLALVGSIEYPGAAYLSCTGSIRAGAGLTTLAIARNLQPMLASKMAEVTYLPLPETSQELYRVDSFKLLRQNLADYDVFLIGCGLGQSRPVTELVKNVILDPCNKLPKTILDADGINIIAGTPDWQARFQDNAIFTPHAGEMSKLLKKTIDEIQGNRIDIARSAAKNWNKTIVLKGAYTIIASPEGNVRISPFAIPGLATAGTGDVLAGTIAGLAAQGIPLFEAACCGVFIHGQAGETVQAELGDTGMLASDLLPVLPRVIRQLKEV
jgi:ADP-dependent NAD(P)H-hydrate dehydratase / NAD(P)H-hydrate epimerase